MIGGLYRSVGLRTVNEDTVVYEDVLTDRGNCTLIAVCDGIGSLTHGEVVSGYAAECLVKWFYSEGIRAAHRGSNYLKRSICKCLYDCYMDVSQTAHGLGFKWGTTCTCVLIRRSRYMCLQLGDSMAYVVDPGRSIKPVTKRHINGRGELVKCLGSMGYSVPDVSFGRIGRNKGILVASDGFVNRIGTNELAGMLELNGRLSEDRINRRLAGIGEEIVKRGGTDNRSAVYAVRL